MSQELMNAFMTGVLVPVLVSIGYFLSTLIKKKADQIKAKTKNDELDKYITHAERAIAATVLAVTQTYVDAIKKANGYLTPEQQKQAFNMAKQQILLILSDNAKKAIQDLYGDANKWIDTQIELFVYKTKPPSPATG